MGSEMCIRDRENLYHLTTNLAGEITPTKLVPFLTSKHSLEYCNMYATRAASHGFEALTVLGGDKTVGPPRCVPHANELRIMLRERGLPDTGAKAEWLDLLSKKPGDDGDGDDDDDEGDDANDGPAAAEDVELDEASQDEATAPPPATDAQEQSSSPQ